MLFAHETLHVLGGVGEVSAAHSPFVGQGSVAWICVAQSIVGASVGAGVGAGDGAAVVIAGAAVHGCVLHDC